MSNWSYFLDRAVKFKLFLNSLVYKITTDQIDNVRSAEIPDQTGDNELLRVVDKNMD